MAIPGFEGYKAGVYLKPKDDIDPKQKAEKPEYSREYSKFIYSNFMRETCAIKPHMHDRFIRARKYAEGCQDTNIYKNLLFGSESERPEIPVAVVDNGSRGLADELVKEDLGMENINWDDVFSPLPKYVGNIVGIMQSQDHTVVVDAEDENSGTMREEMKFGSWVRAELQMLTKSFFTIMGIPDANTEPVKPKSLEELELFDNIGAFKLPYEIGMEKALEHTNFISRLDKETKDRIIEDFIIQNYACLITEEDPNSGKVLTKRADVLDIILEDSREQDFNDSTWGGRIEYYTLHNLRIQTGWSEERIEQLANHFTGNFGNPQSFEDNEDHGKYNYDDFRIPVLHSFWKTVDSEYYTQRNARNGPIEVYEPYSKKGKAPKEKKGRDLNKTDIRRLYHARWVIDTEEVFDYGIYPNTPYNFGKNDVEFPIELIRLSGKAKIESMIPIEDQIFLTYLKTQNAIAKAAPPGLAIEWGSIANLKYGKKKLKPKDSIRLYTNTGNIVYQLQPKSLPGQPGQGVVSQKPIVELRGGLGTAITDGIAGIEFLYKQLDIITGIDGISSLTQMPSRDTGKAVQEMAQAATSNTLKPIYSGFIRLKEKSACTSAWFIQSILDAYDDIEECPYFRVLGRANLLAIKAAGAYPPAMYGFRIEAKATEAQKQRILESAQAGLQSGKNGIPALTYSEFSFILRYLDTGKSIKYLELYMAKREQERREEEQKRAQDNIRVQEEEQRKTKQETAKADMDKISAETNGKLSIEKEKGKQERETLDKEYTLKGRLLDKEIRLKSIDKVKLDSSNN